MVRMIPQVQTAHNECCYSKGDSRELELDRTGQKYCTLETLGHWTLETIGHWTLETLGYWTLETLRPWTLETLGHWTLETLHSVET